MARVVRPVWAVIAAAFAVFISAFMTSAVPGAAQSAPPAPTAAQMSPFVGDWVVTTAMGGTQTTSTLSVKNDGGKVTATLAPE